MNSYEERGWSREAIERHRTRAREYARRPDIIARQKAYEERPDVKERHRTAARNWARRNRAKPIPSQERSDGR